MIFAPHFVQIGFIEKTHGTNGWLKVNNSENSISSEMEFLFLEQFGQKVPYKIAEFNPSASLLKLHELNSPEEAQQFANTGLFAIAEEDAPTKERDLVGFAIRNPQDQLIGTILSWEDIPGNPLLLVKTDQGNVFLPFNQDLILDFDHKRKTIIYQIPDGLLEL